MNKNKWILVAISVLLVVVCSVGIWMLHQHRVKQELQAQLVADAREQVVRLCETICAVEYSNVPEYPHASEKLSEVNALYNQYFLADMEIKTLVENANQHFQSLRENPALNYDCQALLSIVEESVKNKVGNWSVYIEIPGTDFCVEHNNRQVIAASTIKLFNMVTLFSEVRAGNVELTDAIYATTENMIQQSSNSASNAVVSHIGQGDFFAGAKKVTETAKSIGCVETQEQHKLFDVYEYSPGWNLTSVRDCGLVLRKLYMGECISPAYDAQMIDILKGQTRRFKIPQGLPEGTVVANKTGENFDVEMDVAIVYAPNCDYILCISVTDFNGGAVRATMADLSGKVYAFFDNPN